MLKNDPPSGTPLRIIKENRTGKLIRPLKKYWTDRPEDEFEIEYPDGARKIVRRDEIEQI